MRSLKSVDLHVRPIHHRVPDRVRAHVLVAMLASNENFGVYLDSVSFDKLIGDAKEGNAILFDKLGLTP